MIAHGAKSPIRAQTDEACRFCRRGDENLCEQALFTGWDVDGGFAEYTVASAGFVCRPA